MEPNVKLSSKISMLKCKCEICGEEMTVQQSKDHPQTDEEHVVECEGCGFKEKKMLVKIHQRQCASFVFLENKILRDDNIELRKENKRVSETIQVLNEEIERVNKVVKTLEKEIEEIKEKLERDEKEKIRKKSASKK